jgi:hypothetical protein
LLDQPDDLQLFGSRISHSSLPPSAIMLFLSRRNSRACSATTSFSAWASRRRSLTSNGDHALPGLSADPKSSLSKTSSGTVAVAGAAVEPAAAGYVCCGGGRYVCCGGMDTSDKLLWEQEGV